MNWKLVLKIYGNLRQLTDDESALLNTLRAMNDTERELLVESLQPQKSAGKKAVKVERKVEHCVACDYTKRHAVHKDSTRDDYHEFQPSSSASKKSQRAAGIKEQLNKNLSQQRVTDNHKCVYESDGKICLGLEGDAIHDATMGYGGYHEFVPPAQSAAASGD